MVNKGDYLVLGLVARRVTCTLQQQQQHILSKLRLRASLSAIRSDQQPELSVKGDSLPVITPAHISFLSPSRSIDRIFIVRFPAEKNSRQLFQEIYLIGVFYLRLYVGMYF